MIHLIPRNSQDLNDKTFSPGTECFVQALNWTYLSKNANQGNRVPGKLLSPAFKCPGALMGLLCNIFLI